MVKGIPVLAISPINPEITKNYLSILPPFLKKKVYNLGSYYTLTHSASKIREVLDFLESSPEDGAIVSARDGLFTVLHTLANNLVEDLLKLGFKVILDRSPISHYGYNSCIYHKEDPEKVKELLKENVAYFFIESPKRYISDLRSAKFYDMIAPELNLKLKHWVKGVNTKIGGLIHILSSEESFEENFDKIKKALQNLPN